MKKWSILSLSMLMVAGLMFSGCSDDDDDTVDLGPSIILKTGEGYTYEDFEVEEGSSVKFGVIAQKSTTHDNNLTRFNLNYNDLTLVDSTFNSSAFNGDYEIQFEGVGEATLVFKVTAEGGLTAETELNVTIVESGVQVSKVTGIELGSFNDVVGSFYNTVDNEVYAISEAMLNQEKVDFLFFKGAENINTIAAPDDEAAADIDTFMLDQWTTKNQTRFNLTEMDAEAFDAIEDIHIFPDFNDEEALTRVNELEVDQVVLFRTEAGKLGYFKVVDMYTRGDLITIDVIVEL
jgi:hypothetical protein